MTKVSVCSDQNPLVTQDTEHSHPRGRSKQRRLVERRKIKMITRREDERIFSSSEEWTFDHDDGRNDACDSQSLRAELPFRHYIRLAWD